VTRRSPWVRNLSKTCCTSRLWGCGAPTKYMGMFESRKIIVTATPDNHARSVRAFPRFRRWGRHARRRRGRLGASFPHSLWGRCVWRDAEPGEPIRRPSCFGAEPGVESPAAPTLREELEVAYSYDESNQLRYMSQRRGKSRRLKTQG